MKQKNVLFKINKAVDRVSEQVDIMRILIIEDKEKHILSAKKFAAECGKDVTIVTSYADAEKVLCGGDRFGREEPVKRFEVVLTDLLLPAGKEGLGDPGKFIGTEQPYGLNIALLAMRLGIKAIGILTDGGHHNHPMIWALDTLKGYDGKPFTVGETTVLCSSKGPAMYENLQSDDPLYGAKDWMEFWLMLVGARSPMVAL